MKSLRLLAPLAVLLTACGEKIVTTGIADCKSASALAASRSLASMRSADLVGHVDRTAIVLPIKGPVSIDDDASVTANDPDNGGAIIWRKTGIRKLTELGAVNRSKGDYAIGQRGTASGPGALVDPAGTATELGLLPGSARSVPTAMNALGLVVGRSIPQATYASADYKPFFWTRCDGITTLANDSGGTAVAINLAGDVVGNVMGEPRTIVRNALASHAILWHTQNGTTLDLHSIVAGQYRETMANGINDAGVVVGFSGRRPFTPRMYDVGRAWRWTAADGVTDLGNFGGDYAEAIAVNNRGEVIGVSNECPTVPGHCYPIGFIWTRQGGMERLEPADSLFVPIGINDQGEVLGTRLKSGSGYTRAVVLVPTANVPRWQ